MHMATVTIHTTDSYVTALGMEGPCCSECAAYCGAYRPLEAHEAGFGKPCWSCEAMAREEDARQVEWELSEEDRREQAEKDEAAREADYFAGLDAFEARFA